MKKTLSALLAVIMVIGILSGCGDSKEKTSTKVDPNNPFANKQELSIAFWDAKNFGKDSFYDELVKKFNIEPKFVNLEWTDWEQQLRIMAASDEVPDYTVGTLPSGDYFKFATDGVLKAIPDDLTQYPNLKKYLSNPIIDNFKVDGKLYTVPRAHNREFGEDNVVGYRLIVRKDWLKQCGLSEPQTYEEFLEMNKTFVDKNMSGGKNTVGYTADSANMIFYPFNFGMGKASDSWTKIDGKWFPGALSEGNKEWISLLQKYYKLGAIDKDFPLIKSGEGYTKFITGKAGSTIKGLSASDWNSVKTEFENNNPGKLADDCLQILPFMKNKDGVIQLQNDPLIGTGSFFGKNISDDAFDRLLRMIDYFLTDEGVIFSMSGIEGKDYKIENDKFVSLMPIDETTGKPKDYRLANPTSSLGTMSYWMVDYAKINKAIPEKTRKEVIDMENYLKENSIKQEKHLDIDWWSNDALTKWNYYTSLMDGITKIVATDKNVDEEFDKLVEEAMQSGGKAAIEAVNNNFK